MARNAWLTSTLTVTAVAIAGLSGAPAASADGPVVVPMPAIFRGCSFTAKTFVPAVGDGRALASINPVQRGTLAAQVSLATAKPGTHYVVRLIQMPRTSLGCAPGDPGVTTASLDTDGVGAATVDLQAAALPGTTGAWVSIDLPAEYSQIPIEHYTSDFIASV